jgi:hypothetical protein
MSDTPEVPPAEAEPTEPAPPEPPPPKRRPRLIGPIVLAAIIGFGLLAGAIAYVLEHEPPRGVEPARVAALEDQVGALRQRVEALEKRPAPTPLAAPPASDLRPLEARIAALEQRPAPAPQPPPPAPDLGPLQSRIDTLEHRVGELARLQAAAEALDAGQPLGTWPGAPPALARFANEKPPTIAELRLAFTAAARRAAQESRPKPATGSFAERMWTNIASLVTVREGDRVIVGSPATVVLDAARERLDAGDLAGAVAALDALDAGAAAAMADWRARAQSLLDARAALAQLTRA